MPLRKCGSWWPGGNSWGHQKGFVLVQLAWNRGLRCLLSLAAYVAIIHGLLSGGKSINSSLMGFEQGYCGSMALVYGANVGCSLVE